MDGVERPRAPGKWNARQILCHLADVEIVFAFRLRQAPTRGRSRWRAAPAGNRPASPGRRVKLRARSA
ncbi:MAG: DinB family protein [Bryobacteraceae bacterium]